MGESNGHATNPSRSVRDVARSEVLDRHATLGRNGRPLFCTPSRAEIRGTAIARPSRGTDGKVVYPSREAAETAARELEQLGARPLRSYLCARSHRGHYHLTSDAVAARVAHERIPQQGDRRAAVSAPPHVRTPGSPFVLIPQQRDRRAAVPAPHRVPTPAELFALIPQQRRPLSA
jgi:hypothetical protein